MDTRKTTSSKYSEGRRCGGDGEDPTMEMGIPSPLDLIKMTWSQHWKDLVASAGSDHRCDARRGVSDCGDGTCLKNGGSPRSEMPHFHREKRWSKHHQASACHRAIGAGKTCEDVRTWWSTLGKRWENWEICAINIHQTLKPSRLVSRTGDQRVGTPRDDAWPSDMDIYTQERTGPQVTQLYYVRLSWMYIYIYIYTH